MKENKTVRRFGYYIAQPDGTLDIGHLDGELPKEVWTEFERIIQVIVDLRPFIIDYLSLENNFAIFHEIDKDLVNALQGMQNAFSFGGVGQTIALAKAQGLLSNFLFSASAFRDRSVTRLREQYGKGSLELRQLNAVVKDAYDGSFSYRLLYNLRNYAQHHDSPLSVIPVQAERQASGTMAFTISLILTPKDLLNSPIIQKNFRPELVNNLGDINLMVPVREFFLCHQAMMKVIIDIHIPRLVELQQYGRAIFTKMNLPAGAIPVIWEGEERPPTRFHHFSFDEFAFLKRLHDGLSATKPS